MQGPRKDCLGTWEASQTVPSRSLSPLQVGLFFTLVIALAIGTGMLFRDHPALKFLRPILLEASVYSILALPLAYLFSPRTFTMRHWHLPIGSLKWIVLIAALQLATVYMQPYPIPVNPYMAFGALITAPLVEEVVRAVMICPLVERWGPLWAVATTTILFTLIHPDPIRIFAGQVALAVLFLYSDCSILVCAIAHSLMNAVAIWHSGISPAS